MMLLNVIKLLWPFIKEMIIGKNSLRYAIRKNRIRVAFFFAVILSFVVTWVTVPKLFMISANYIKIEQELKATRETMAGYAEDKAIVDQAKEELLMLRAKVIELEKKKQPVVEQPKPKTVSPNKITEPNPVNNSVSSQHKIDQVRKRLNSLEN